MIILSFTVVGRKSSISFPTVFYRIFCYFTPAMQRLSYIRFIFLLLCALYVRTGEMRAQQSSFPPVKTDTTGMPVVAGGECRRIPIIPSHFKPTSLILPASLIAVGAVGTAIDGMNDFHLFQRKASVKRIHIDDYMEWGMLGWVFVADFMGKEKHNWADQLCLVVLAEGMNAAMTRTLKYTVREIRPDGRPYSFPSGHTANAFLGAHLAYKELKDSSPIGAYSGYALAAFVAGSRLYNNRHWVADVVAGAGFGILSVELAYLVYFPVRNAIARKINLRRSDKLIFTPAVGAGGAGVYVSYAF